MNSLGRQEPSRQTREYRLIDNKYTPYDLFRCHCALERAEAHWAWVTVGNSPSDRDALKNTLLSVFGWVRDRQGFESDWLVMPG